MQSKFFNLIFIPRTRNNDIYLPRYSSIFDIKLFPIEASSRNASVRAFSGKAATALSHSKLMLPSKPISARTARIPSQIGCLTVKVSSRERNQVGIMYTVGIMQILQRKLFFHLTILPSLFSTKCFYLFSVFSLLFYVIIFKSFCLLLFYDELLVYDDFQNPSVCFINKNYVF